MLGFIIRRTLWTIPVVLLATLITFVLVKQLPYEQDIFNNPKYSPSQVKALRELYGLNDSFLVQYVHFLRDLVPTHVGFSTKLRDLVTFDLGNSTKPGALRIWDDIVAIRLPVSMKLGTMAFIFAAFVGTGLGVLSALRTNGPIDYAITLFSTLAFALPTFVTATLWVKYSPYYGWDTWSLRIGPILLLGLSIMPYFTRLVRASMLEALQQEYVTTARSKGIPWRTTVVRHALRNSLIPTIVNAGPLFGFVLTGSFLIERIMNVPGIAGEFVSAFGQPLDNKLILVTTVLLSVIIILMNLVVDVIVGWLDPRVSHD
ncbi:MAG: binding-protein-dependent transport system inner rane component [Thermoleophilia bacterium]|nr:binding-protein-dependent transport system inner rane component [Thermoleophilia bacterium]